MNKLYWKNISKAKRLNWLISCAMSRKEAHEINCEDTDELPDEIKEYIDENGCPDCGCSSFYAHQQCRVDIVVDNNNNFVQNLIDDKDLGDSVYDSETPYGPYQCIECGKEFEEIPKEK